jgi:NAD(P)-dependent dehydrogenase (short-subunit alcohol dehydrogenase family)
MMQTDYLPKKSVKFYYHLISTANDPDMTARQGGELTKQRLDGRVAVLTGAAGGIGRALALALLDAGARVALMDIDGDGLDAFAGDALGGIAAERWLAIAADVSDAEACEDAVARAADAFGHVDILINNAALGMGVVRADHMTVPVGLDEVTPDIWRRFVDVNFGGVYAMTRAAVPVMRQRGGHGRGGGRGGGRVITVTTSFFTMLRRGFFPYGAIKAGVEAASAGWAKEFAEAGITVNIVVPGGPTDTPMVPVESGYDRAALIPPQAMAPPMIWLASDAAATVTGMRYIAADWDPTLPDAEAAARCGAPIGWPDLAQDPVWPGGRPGD